MRRQAGEETTDGPLEIERLETTPFARRKVPMASGLNDTSEIIAETTMATESPPTSAEQTTVPAEDVSAATCHAASTVWWERTEATG